MNPDNFSHLQKAVKKIGFTTTIPVEFILAKGYIPVDLNNIFMSSGRTHALIDEAHLSMLPRNLCAWIKGLYSIAVKDKIIDEIISVTHGDCSNTQSLTEIYESNNIKIHRFAYPKESSDKYTDMKNEMLKLASSFEINFKDVLEFSKITDIVRKKLKKIDELTIEGKVSGFENHLYLVSSTDFNSDLDKFSSDLDNLITEAEAHDVIKKDIRLGYIGVPPIMPKIYDFIESRNCKIVFNEVQRQFTIPSLSDDYIMRYIDYTYPYSVWDRIKDIKEQIAARKIDGLVHYVQSFCFRQMQDIVIRENINLPILTIEGDTPEELDARTKIRIESFIEMLEAKKRR